jgi:hypothetical protein
LVVAGTGVKTYRHFPVLADLAVDPDPDWDKSRDYLAAAERVVRSSAVRRMLKVSYDVLVVDEYQDCVVEQRGLIKAISEGLYVALSRGRKSTTVISKSQTITPQS